MKCVKRNPTGKTTFIIKGLTCHSKYAIELAKDTEKKLKYLKIPRKLRLTIILSQNQNLL